MVKVVDVALRLELSVATDDCVSFLLPLALVVEVVGAASLLLLFPAPEYVAPPLVLACDDDIEEFLSFLP